jgi:hypothetical protein
MTLPDYHDVTVQELMDILKEFDPNDTIRVVNLVENGKDRYDEFINAGYTLVYQPVSTPEMRLQAYGLTINDYLITLRSKEI